jgi:hypothetical protein
LKGLELKEERCEEAMTWATNQLQDDEGGITSEGNEEEYLRDDIGF